MGDVSPQTDPFGFTIPDQIRYADQAAVDAHKASSKMAWLQQTEKEESNMTEPVKVLPLDQFAGWVSRV